MRKLYIVRHARDFDRIMKENHCVKNTCFVVYYQENQLPYNRYGISVSKKLGNAVFRNSYKRKIRSIIDNYKKDYIKGKDYIIILRRGALEKEYQELEKQLTCLL
ncbi:MAG: ribonuclease P protein component [Bacilli bacterium]|nr:ribonuclease P protein component [Bacilli bacterium]